MNTGSRWVLAQFLWLLLIGVTIVMFGGKARPATTLVAIVLFVAGQGMAIAAALQMRQYLTAHPAPAPGAALLRKGIYRRVRHPMYGGVLLMAAAVSIFDVNLVAGVLTLGLAGLFYGKSSYEETLLVDTFLGYPEYQKLVTKRFIPWVL